MSKALDGVRILDFTHVQSGPTCTQLLAWFGADVIKVERAGDGDATRGQLRDIPGVDSLYFTMLNHNKRSITLDTKNPKGKQILDTLIKQCDVMVENFAPGALDRMGITWEHIQQLNPRMIVASVKGFGPGPYEDCKVYENVAQCAGGSASTTGFDDGPPMVTGAQIGDSGTGLHLALGIVAALYQRKTTGRGQKVLAPMQDAVLNLCRVKLRDQQRLERTGTMHEYPQYPDGKFGEAVPRAGNASGGGQPGSILKCKGWETDPNAYIYFITQAAVWPAVCKVIGEEGEWAAGRDRGILLSQRPCGRVARIGEDLRAMFHLGLVQRLELRFAEEDLASDLETPALGDAAQLARNIGDREDVGRDVLAHATVTARRGSPQSTILVTDTEGEAVHLRLDGKGERRRFDVRAANDALAPSDHLVGLERVVEAEHRYGVLDRGELL